MVVLNRIYTRVGDDGSTALGTGERRSKADARVETYGLVDELNAVLGLARIHAEGEIERVISRIQNDLFDVGADLCAPGAHRSGEERLRVTDAQVEWLEGRIDALNADLAPLRSFVLPGGAPLAAHLHVARTVCRRAERAIVALRERPSEPVSGPVLRYLNRLSDLLFVAARAANENGARDVLWVPGQNR